MYLCFSHSFHQLIVRPKKTTEWTKTLIQHILANSPDSLIQSGVIEMGSSDHELIYCSKKNAFFEMKWALRDFSKVQENFPRWSFCRKIKINKVSSDFPNYTWVNNIYQDFVTNFLSVVNFAAPGRPLRVKFNILVSYLRFKCYSDPWLTL